MEGKEKGRRGKEALTESCSRREKRPWKNKSQRKERPWKSENEALKEKKAMEIRKKDFEKRESGGKQAAVREKWKSEGEGE